MIHKTDLLDPNALMDRSEYEKNVIDGAQNAGHGPKHLNTVSSGRSHSGALQQVVIPSAILAAELDAPGCCSDISDGKAELSECMEIHEPAGMR
jgi:hypothetical protein